MCRGIFGGLPTVVIDGVRQVNARVTVVVTPRDRYSQLEQCIVDLYTFTNESLFELVILDLGYPERDLDCALEFLKDKENYRVASYGMMIPMAAMDIVRDDLDTEFVVFIDNDTRVRAGWLPPLLDAASATGAAVVSPVVLEAAGVDDGAELRTHLFTTQLKLVEVDRHPYLLEYKDYRRAPPETLPEVVTDTEAFELHCVMFRTDVLADLELPMITIREHLDIGLQLRAKGLRLVVQPSSRVLFDNLGTRAKLSDLRYFNLRWNAAITKASSRLFEKRWGYKFYSEEAIYVWASRRRRFLLLRWLHIPVHAANFFDRAWGGLRSRINPVWDPVASPEENSVSIYSVMPENYVAQLDHSVHSDP